MLERSNARPTRPPANSRCSQVGAQVITTRPSRKSVDSAPHLSPTVLIGVYEALNFDASSNRFCNRRGDIDRERVVEGEPAIAPRWPELDVAFRRPGERLHVRLPGWPPAPPPSLAPGPHDLSTGEIS